jgi:hypothetical protein
VIAQKKAVKAVEPEPEVSDAEAAEAGSVDDIEAKASSVDDIDIDALVFSASSSLIKKVMAPDIK